MNESFIENDTRHTDSILDMYAHSQTFVEDQSDNQSRQKKHMKQNIQTKPQMSIQRNMHAYSKATTTKWKQNMKYVVLDVFGMLLFSLH